MSPCVSTLLLYPWLLTLSMPLHVYCRARRPPWIGRSPKAVPRWSPCYRPPPPPLPAVKQANTRIRRRPPWLAPSTQFGSSHWYRRLQKLRIGESAPRSDSDLYFFQVNFKNTVTCNQVQCISNPCLIGGVSPRPLACLSVSRPFVNIGSISHR